MADKDTALVVDDAGNEQQIKLPGDVTKATVDAALKAVLPVLREQGQKQAETLKDTLELSFERVAKAIEANRPINEDKVKQVNRLKAIDDAWGATEKKSKQDAIRDLGQYFGAIKRANGDLSRATELADSSYKNERVKSILVESTMGDAGILVPEQVYSQMKRLFEDRSIIRQVASGRATMAGSTKINKEVALASAFYQGENEDLTLSTPEWGQDSISLKKLTVLCAATQELLTDAPNAAGLITQQMVRAYNIKENVQLLRGDGTAHAPKGLRKQIAAGNKFNRTKAGATATAQEIHEDLVKAMQKLWEANHEWTSPDEVGWAMNGTTLAGLMKRLTTDYATGVFFAEVRAGRLMGSPIFNTNAIPNDIGGSSSEVYFGIREHMVIFDAETMEFLTSNEASFKDSTGTLISAFSRQLQVMRMIGRHDFHLMYPEAAALIESVDW